MKIKFFMLALMLSMAFSIASPSVNFQNPTAANGTTTTVNQTYINFSTNETGTGILSWNGTNITLDSPTLVLNMHFDQNTTAGNATLDSSRYGNNGTKAEGNITNEGKFGRAFKSDGVNDVIYIPDSDTFNLDSFTLEAWINTTDAGSARRRIVTQQGATFWFMSTISNVLEFGCNAVILSSGGTLNTGTWRHVAVMRDIDANLARWFVDGVEISNTSLSGFCGNGTLSIASQVYISTYNGVDESFTGLIDEVKVWNRSKTHGEMITQYKAEYGRYNTTQFFANMTDQRNGTYLYTAYVGSGVSETRTVTISTVPAPDNAPSLILDSPENITYSSGNISLSYRAGDDIGVSQCVLVFNGSSTQLANCQNTTFLANEGYNTITLTVNDTANQTASVIRSFTVDTINPTLAIDTPANATFASSNITLLYRAGNVQLDKCLLRVNGGSPIDLLCKNGTFIAIQGSNVINITVNDSAGRNTSQERFFTMDNITPFVQLFLPANATFNSSNSTIEFTVIDTNRDRCFYSVDNGENVTIAGCQNSTFFAENGFHTFTLFGNDTAGNLNSSTAFFTMDAPTPTPTPTPSSDVSPATRTIANFIPLIFSFLVILGGIFVVVNAKTSQELVSGSILIIVGILLTAILFNVVASI